MKRVILSLALVSMLAHAQETTFGERLVYVGAATVAFSCFDFIGYNLTKSDATALGVYRVVQLAAQGALTYWLWDTGGWKCAVAFNLIWWTWTCDWIYYGAANAVNAASPWENRTDNGLNREVTWAYWTPIGIGRGFMRDEPIAKDALAAQSAVGLSISIVILI